jgi:uncharacterized protein with NRDE domain
MCLILMAYEMHPRYRLILAANRDEFYDRPTAAAAYWEDAPDLFAGKDLVHGGTWFGVNRRGRFGALTNYRDPNMARQDAPSRGGLVSGFLQTEAGAGDYLEQLAGDASVYNGFNLLLGDVESECLCYSNVSGQSVRLTPGIHGLSNHLLDTPWPKVMRGREALAKVVAAPEFSREDLFAILADRTQAPVELLPDTGVGLELERLLSSIFIASPRYGTRSSSLLLVDRERRMSFVERSFGGDAVVDREVCWEVG